jgi:integral membrane protein (TIGR01906 family)
MKALSKIIATLCCFSLCVGFICLAVGMVAYSRWFYNHQFEINNTSEDVGLSNEDLGRLRDGWIAYFSGRSDTLQIEVSFHGGPPTPFYNDDELSHMEDVKVIFLAVRTLGWVLMSVGVVLLAASIFTNRTKKDRMKTFSFGSILGCAVFLTIGITLGIVIAVNFEDFFILFHEIFFPQGNWQFSTPMVAILTESLFMDAAIYILCIGVSFTILLLASGIVVKALERKTG